MYYKEVRFKDEKPLSGGFWHTSRGYLYFNEKDKIFCDEDGFGIYSDKVKTWLKPTEHIMCCESCAWSNLEHAHPCDNCKGHDKWRGNITTKQELLKEENIKCPNCGDTFYPDEDDLIK